MIAYSVIIRNMFFEFVGQTQSSHLSPAFWSIMLKDKLKNIAYRPNSSVVITFSHPKLLAILGIAMG